MRYAFVIPLLLAISIAHAQDSPADRIAPALTDTAVAVGRLDLKALDVEAALAQAKRFVPPDDAQSKQVGQVVRGAVASLEAAGVDEVFAVVDAREIGASTGVYLVIPATDSLNRDAVLALTSNLPFEVSEEVNGSLVIGSKSVLERLKSAEQPTARDGLADAFAATTGPIQIVIAPSADQHRVLRETLPDLPADLAGTTGEQLAAGLQWASFGTSFEPKLTISLVVQSESEQAAEALKATLVASLQRIAEDPRLADAVPVLPMLIKAFQPQREGDRLVVKADESLDAIAKTLTGLAGIARESANQSASANNLKQIGLAMHNFHDTYGSFPPAASYDANGKPLLSWRVYLLPFLEHAHLYQKFHLDEPWDSGHNRTLIEHMPPVYRSPLANLPPGQTTYLAPVGKGLVFDGKAGTPFSKITDGTSNTVLILEATAAKPVPWTKPEDLAIDPMNPLAGLTEGREIIPMLFGDGSVHRESTQGDAQTFYDLMTRAGGEVIEWQKLKSQ